jgi:predicted dienelactone hydrolase
MFNIRLPLLVVEVLFSAVLTLGCGSSKGNSPHDSGAGDTVTLDSLRDSGAGDTVTLDTPRDSGAGDTVTLDIPGDQGAGVTVTLNVTDIGATYANKFIYVGLVAGEVSCESNTDPKQYVGGGMVTSGTCAISIADVPQGTYTACAFLDADDNSQPTAGDLEAELSLSLSGDHIETSSLTSWVTIPGQVTTTPPLAGPYKVGYQELTFTDSTRGRTLKTALWYPTVDGEENATSAFDGGAPNLSGAPYPLIVFSHGDHGRSTNGQADFLKNTWAGQGFVVVAPDHQKNTSYDFDDSDANRAAIQFDRPIDIRFVTDQILLLNADASSFLYGLVNPEAIGVSGHSFGGHTTLIVAGATPNLDHLADTCQVNPDNWDICLLQDKIQQLYPGQRIINESDSRMKAALSLAGDGYGWFLADGMAKIKIPTMFMVGRLDTTCPLDTQAMPEYEGVMSTKYLFIQDKADHMSYTNTCSQSTSSDCSALHEQIEFVTVDFWMLHLKNDATYDAKLRDYASSQQDATLLSQVGK